MGHLVVYLLVFAVNYVATPCSRTFQVACIAFKFTMRYGRPSKRKETQTFIKKRKAKKSPNTKTETETETESEASRSVSESAAAGNGAEAGRRQVWRGRA